MKPLLVLIAAVTYSFQPQAPQSDRPVAPVNNVKNDAIPIEFSGVPTPEPPDRPGAWSVVVAKRGGIAGFGRSFVTTTSAGAVTCGGQTVPCRSALDRPALSALSDLAARSLPAFDASRASICSDCISTFVLLTRRDDAGRLERRMASWDMTTERNVPPDLIRLASTTTANALRAVR